MKKTFTYIALAGIMTIGSVSAFASSVPGPGDKEKKETKKKDKKSKKGKNCSYEGEKKSCCSKAAS